MTGIDTSDEAVERVALYFEGWAEGVRMACGPSVDADQMESAAALLRALLATRREMQATLREIVDLPGERQDEGAGLARRVLKTTSETAGSDTSSA